MAWGRQRRFDVVGWDAYGRPMVGAPVRVNPGVGPVVGPVQDPNAAAEALRLLQHGYMPNPAQMQAAQDAAGQNYLPLVSPSGPAPVPSWRGGQIAPGVNTVDEGMVALPLVPQQNAGQFTSTVTQIIFQGQLQKPYRAERLLVDVVKTGTTAVGKVQGQIFVGTDLQQGDILPIFLESLGAPGSFGTRLTLQQAPPGVLIRIIASLTLPLTSPDTQSVTMQFLGRIIH